MLTKAEVEIRSALNIATAMLQSFSGLERVWPQYKRGSKAQIFLTRLKEQRDAIELCLQDAIEAKDPKNG